MSSETFVNPRDSNTTKLRVNIPLRETEILRAVYQAAGEPEPDSDSTLSHNTAESDYWRAILRGEIDSDSFDIEEPSDLGDGWLPLELTITPDEYRALESTDIDTVRPSQAFKRNSRISQKILNILSNFCNEVVRE